MNRIMEPHFALSDSEFETLFATVSLEPKLFTHEAHLRLAWIHLSTYGEKIAIENITSQLQNYVLHLGASDKYNETLTVAAIKAVKHFMQKEPIKTFAEFITTHARLKTDFKNLMAQHYGFDLYRSAKAKEVYMEPDLLEFT
jgi:hypothetical protein